MAAQDKKYRRLSHELQGVDDERAQLQDELEKYVCANPSEVVDEEFRLMHRELQTWQDGRYADSVRLIYYTQQKSLL
jgi:hypothetical protein